MPEGDEPPHPLPAPSNLYHEEWKRLFESPDFSLSRLKDHGLQGELRSCRFRSIFWRVYLECLPDAQSEWVSRTRALREEYADLKKVLVTDPWQGDASQHPDVNNPLSQEEKSNWNKYFQDENLRLTIQQDVTRTFPEIEFFQSAEVQEMMVNILFCYSKKNSSLSYKQGMHELLAPMLFVLSYDHQSFLHASELELIRENIAVLLDPQHAEADAYHMFNQLMEKVKSWFIAADPLSNNSSVYQPKPWVPFQQPPGSSVDSHIGLKLMKINDQLVKRHDPPLHAHLEALEIGPQLYGIRWLRLLFGREFSMQDLLVLWDAIFATSLHLVDYIFAAMLINIRHHLLPGDYVTCLNHLMHYPTVTDINAILQLALMLKDPSLFTGESSLSEDVLKLLKLNFRPRSKMRPTALPMMQQQQQQAGEGQHNNLKKAWIPSAIKNLAAVQKSPSPSGNTDGRRTSFSGTRTPGDDSVIYHRSFSATLGQQSSASKVAHSSFKELRPLRPQHLALAGGGRGSCGHREMVDYCCGKLSGLIDRLQLALTSQGTLQHEDDIFLALAGLKHVRDVLKGEVGFKEAALEDKDFSSPTSELGTLGFEVFEPQQL